MSLNGDAFMDSEDLMTWLLLHPEMDFDNLTSSLPDASLGETDGSCSSTSLPMPLSGQQPLQYFKVYGPAHGAQHAFPDDPLLPSHFPHSDVLPQNALSHNALSQYAELLPPPSAEYALQVKTEASPSVPLSLPLPAPLSPAAQAGSCSSSAKRSSRTATAASAANSSSNSSNANNNNSSSKKRPRENNEDLEARVQQLRRENADLHAHLLTVTQRTTEVQRQRVAMERMMTQRLAALEERESDEDDELAAIVKQYTDIYADYGRCRQREVAFHLQQLESLLVPTMTTKMCLWALQQENAFYQRATSPMYDLLCQELEITPEQTNKIVQRRERIKYLLSQLQESLSLLQSLKEATEKKHSSYDHVCGRVQDSARATQTVRFLIWITRHADRIAQYVPGFTVRNAYVPPAEFVAEMMMMQTTQQQQPPLSHSVSQSSLSNSLSHASLSSSHMLSSLEVQR